MHESDVRWTREKNAKKAQAECVRVCVYSERKSQEIERAASFSPACALYDDGISRGPDGGVTGFPHLFDGFMLVGSLAPPVGLWLAGRPSDGAATDGACSSTRADPSASRAGDGAGSIEAGSVLTGVAGSVGAAAGIGTSTAAAGWGDAVCGTALVGVCGGMGLTSGE